PKVVGSNPAPATNFDDFQRPSFLDGLFFAFFHSARFEPAVCGSLDAKSLLSFWPLTAVVEKQIMLFSAPLAPASNFDDFQRPSFLDGLFFAFFLSARFEPTVCGSLDAKSLISFWPLTAVIEKQIMLFSAPLAPATNFDDFQRPS
ncbi:MAG: hypothetical protein CL674_05750, partial [Bdellovibrionaceae bacterium]|nr:hypothetical protein [Pseudobdellovibrionaceae bacterium]